MLAILFPSAVSADDSYGLEESARQAKLINNSGNTPDLPVVIGNIIFTLLGFLGVVFFVLVLYGGFMWMTARGNKEQVSSAIDIVKNAAIGLVIILASYLITSFVLDKVLESTIGGGGGGGQSWACVNQGTCTTSVSASPLTDCASATPPGCGPNEECCLQ